MVNEEAKKVAAKLTAKGGTVFHCPALCYDFSKYVSVLFTANTLQVKLNEQLKIKCSLSESIFTKR